MICDIGTDEGEFAVFSPIRCSVEIGRRETQEQRAAHRKPQAAPLNPSKTRHVRLCGAGVGLRVKLPQLEVKAHTARLWGGAKG